MKNKNNKDKIGAEKNSFGFFAIFFTTFFLFFISAANAQFSLPSVGNIKPTISLSSDPETPLPNSAVTITANVSGVIGGGNLTYDWFLNGIKQSGASDKNTLTFKTGAIGTVYKVSVNVGTPSSELSDTINFTVSDVDLTWVANSQAPANYRAKLMPSRNSSIAISAFPFIYRPGTKNRISQNGLTYSWSINGKFDSNGSGAGKDSYIIRTANYLGSSYSVRLEVKTADGAVSLNKFIEIPIAKPQIWTHFYDTKTGQPFGAALRDLTIKLTNINFIAQAYFFVMPMENLKWSWFVDNSELGGSNEKPWLASLNLSKDFSGQFSAQIQAIAKNPNDELEMGQSTINLEIK